MMRRFFLFLCLCFSLSQCDSTKVEESKYTIARDPSWYPLQLENSSAVKMVGFTNALISEIAKDQKIPFTILNTNWVSLYQGLIEEQYPAIFSTLPLNQITLSKYSFSEPFVLLGPVLVVSQNSHAESLLDLKAKIVGVSAFSDAALIVQAYPSIIIQLYEKMTVALDDLEAGAIDGVLMDTLEAHALIPSQYSGILKIVSAPLNNRGIRVMTLKDQNKNLISSFNQGLANLKDSGKYESLRKEFKLY